MKTHNFLLFILIIGHRLDAQAIAFNNDNWNINAEHHAFYTLKGQQTLHIFEGVASPKVSIDFKTGIIENDIYVTPDRGFPGLSFRVKDKDNYEQFYIRPHQPGNPDAIQYTPVYNDYAGWQMYVGEGYSTAVTFKMNDWNSIKLVVAENDAEVFINDMDEPIQYMSKLKEEVVSGSIQLVGGGPVGVRYANFKIKKEVNPQLISQKKSPSVKPDRYVSSWQVPSLLKESDFSGLYELTSDFKRNLEWQRIMIESRG